VLLGGAARGRQGLTPGHPPIEGRCALPEADAFGMAIRLRQVECLSCGYRRAIRAEEHRSALDECPKCRYVGWASSAELSEQTRRLLRERPLDVRRRLRVV